MLAARRMHDHTLRDKAIAFADISEKSMRATMVFILIASEHLPFQKSFCCIPVIFGKCTRTAFLSIDLMRKRRDFCVCRTAIEAGLCDGVDIHKNESSFGIHM